MRYGLKVQTQLQAGDACDDYIAQYNDAFSRMIYHHNYSNWSTTQADRDYHAEQKAYYSALSDQIWNAAYAIDCVID